MQKYKKVNKTFKKAKMQKRILKSKKKYKKRQKDFKKQKCKKAFKKQNTPHKTKVKKTFKTAKKQKRHFAFCILHFPFSFYYKRKYNDIKPVSSLLTTTG